MIRTMQLGQFGRRIVRSGGGSGNGPYLDELAVTPRAVWGLRKMVRTSTLCLRARNFTTGVEADIGWSGDQIDLAALMALGGSETVLVPKLYNQMGNSNYDFIQSTVGVMPVVSNAGVYNGHLRMNSARMETVAALPFGTPHWSIFTLHNFTALATRMFIEMSANSSGANTQAAMVYAAATNRLYMYSQNGSGQARQNWADALAGVAQRSYIFDRSIVGNTEEQARQGGANQTMTNTGGSTEQTGNFNSYKLYLAGRADGTLMGDMSLYNLAVYDAATSSVLSSIESIVGTNP